MSVTENFHDYATAVEDELLTRILIESNAASKQKKENDAFPVILHEVLSKVGTYGLDYIISWQPHGRCFLVHNEGAFVDFILQFWFEQRKFLSFHRTLNQYGFRRIKLGRDKGGFYHEKFLRGKSFLCHQIQRGEVKRGANRGSHPDFYKMSFLPTPTCAGITQDLCSILVSPLKEKFSFPNKNLQNNMPQEQPTLSLMQATRQGIVQHQVQTHTNAQDLATQNQSKEQAESQLFLYSSQVNDISTSQSPTNILQKSELRNLYERREDLPHQNRSKKHVSDADLYAHLTQVAAGNIMTHNLLTTDRFPADILPADIIEAKQSENESEGQCLLQSRVLEDENMLSDAYAFLCHTSHGGRSKKS